MYRLRENELIISVQEFAGESVDLYDDVIAGGTSTNGDVKPQINSSSSTVSSEPPINHTPYSNTNGAQNPLPIKRFQLYVGNLTWVRISLLVQLN